MNYRTARLVLGTNSSSTYTEIKRAFRKRAIEVHPDRNSSSHARVVFQTCVSAYRCLMEHTTYFQRTRYLSGRSGNRLALVRVDP